ncbi:hypothetical protein M1N58_02050 [Dehalococcoidales bacterium]|nr:hypothetical protein [Dehalococcoidales bacterium]
MILLERTISKPPISLTGGTMKGSSGLPSELKLQQELMSEVLVAVEKI